MSFKPILLKHCWWYSKCFTVRLPQQRAYWASKCRKKRQYIHTLKNNSYLCVIELVIEALQLRLLREFEDFCATTCLSFGKTLGDRAVCIKKAYLKWLQMVLTVSQHSFYSALSTPLFAFRWVNYSDNIHMYEPPLSTDCRGTLQVPYSVSRPENISTVSNIKTLRVFTWEIIHHVFLDKRRMTLMKL